MEKECCICLEAYDQAQTTTPTTVSLLSQIGSHACSHGMCVQCAVTHIIGYEQEFCPYCRMPNAFSEIALTSFVTRNAVEEADALIRTAKFNAVKEKIAFPWICDTMTTLLHGDAYTDDILPSAKLTSSFHVETRSVDRRANGSIKAEFCLSLIGTDDDLPISSPESDHCHLVLECTIQPMPDEGTQDEFLDDNEVLA